MVQEQIEKYIKQIKNNSFQYEMSDEIVVEGDDSTELRMGLLSDIHLDPVTPRQVKHTVEAFDHFQSEQVDMVMINGDVTQTGQEIEFLEWKKVQQQDPLLHVSMGNHELLFEDTKYQLIKHYKELPETHYKINGYHVLKVSPDGSMYESDYSRVVPWLQKHLAVAKDDTGNLPIFVFFHHPIKDTYYSTRAENGFYGDLTKELFDDYPMAVTFSGHNHAPSNHPRAVWQGSYTAVNIPSLHYTQGPMGVGITTYFDEIATSPQALLVEAKGTQVTIRPYDFHSQQYARQQFRFDTNNPETFIYTDERKSQSLPPVFEKNALKKVEVTADAAWVTFKQAAIPEEDELMDVVDQYAYELLDETGEKVFSMNEWAHWVRIPMPEDFTIHLVDLSEQTNYKLVIYPVNGFDIKGQPLSVEFRTC